MWVDDNASALATYGEINTWDVSLITDMSNLFNGKVSSMKTYPIGMFQR